MLIDTPFLLTQVSSRICLDLFEFENIKSLDKKYISYLDSINLKCEDYFYFEDENMFVLIFRSNKTYLCTFENKVNNIIFTYFIPDETYIKIKKKLIIDSLEILDTIYTVDEDKKEEVKKLIEVKQPIEVDKVEEVEDEPINIKPKNIFDVTGELVDDKNNSIVFFTHILTHRLVLTNNENSIVGVSRIHEYMNLFFIVEKKIIEDVLDIFANMNIIEKRTSSKYFKEEIAPSNLLDKVIHNKTYMKYMYDNITNIVQIKEDMCILKKQQFNDYCNFLRALHKCVNNDLTFTLNIGELRDMTSLPDEVIYSNIEFLKVIGLVYTRSRNLKVRYYKVENSIDFLEKYKIQ